MMKNDYKEKLSALIIKLKKDKKTAIMILAAILGMLMILLSGTPTENSTEKKSEGNIEDITEWEDKLQKLIADIEGAGRVRVMITFETSDENVFAYNKDESYRENEHKLSSDYILVKNGGEETGLKLKTVYPNVKGVAVVCDGADNPVTKEQIVSVITALFDISTKNISVVCAE